MPDSVGKRCELADTLRTNQVAEELARRRFHGLMAGKLEDARQDIQRYRAQLLLQDKRASILLRHMQ